MSVIMVNKMRRKGEGVGKQAASAPVWANLGIDVTCISKIFDSSSTIKIGISVGCSRPVRDLHFMTLMSQ